MCDQREENKRLSDLAKQLKFNLYITADGLDLTIYDQVEGMILYFVWDRRYTLDIAFPQLQFTNWGKVIATHYVFDFIMAGLVEEKAAQGDNSKITPENILIILKVYEVEYLGEVDPEMVLSAYSQSL
jgi:hypothetical protein